ncbi:thiamine phosphate phosphatase-like protein [Tasmannia lanceolata]|uniref:thiamine phosphate phosphatase-like protein n=1 Tax=Tasmannia lanceolata TaxID=3420 RepID=UPI0040641C55
MACIVVVFDFDKTIIDCDSDNWVVDEMGATNLFNELLPTMPWNSLMDRMMKDLHSQGKTIEEIADCLERAPLHPQIISAIKSANDFGCDLKIVSDANIFFIETILKHHKLFDYFSEIYTNPSCIDEDGKLRIFPYHDFTSTSHGCNLNICPPNMCKGFVMERIRASAIAEGKKQIIYLGDGKGDFCPSLKLGKGDYLMPRKTFPLWDLICNTHPLNLKAMVHEWSNAEEQERVLLHLIKTISIEDYNSSDLLLSVDSKFKAIPISSHEALLQALPHPH